MYNDESLVMWRLVVILTGSNYTKVLYILLCVFPLFLHIFGISNQLSFVPRSAGIQVQRMAAARCNKTEQERRRRCRHEEVNCTETARNPSRPSRGNKEFPRPEGGRVYRKYYPKLRHMCMHSAVCAAMCTGGEGGSNKAAVGG